MKEATWQQRLLENSQEQMTEKQIRLIIAAVELFGEQGYANTSTKEIARRAQVSEGTIFKHYATKKELLLSISRIIIKNIVEPLADDGLAELFARRHENLEGFIYLLMQNRLRLIEGNIVLIRVLLQEAMFTPEIRQGFIQALLQSHLPDGLRALQAQGLLPARPLPELIGLLIPGIMGFVFSRYILMPGLFIENREEDRRSYAAFLAAGLAAAHEGRKPE